MKKGWMELFKEEDGLGTVELVLIMAVLVGIALIFRHYIFDFVQTIMANLFGGDLDSLQTNPTLPLSN